MYNCDSTRGLVSVFGKGDVNCPRYGGSGDQDIPGVGGSRLFLQRGRGEGGGPSRFDRKVGISPRGPVTSGPDPNPSRTLSRPDPARSRTFGVTTDPSQVLHCLDPLRRPLHVQLTRLRRGRRRNPVGPPRPPWAGRRASAKKTK